MGIIHKRLILKWTILQAYYIQVTDLLHYERSYIIWSASNCW